MPLPYFSEIFQVLVFTQAYQFPECKTLSVKFKDFFIVEPMLYHITFQFDPDLVPFTCGINGKIFTNDFNLNKVAELQGVQVLNVNELATAIRPVVLPGELMKVFVQREGKEPGQGF